MKTILPCLFLGTITLCGLPAAGLKAQTDRSFLEAPEVVREPEAYYKYSAHSRNFTGIPSMAVTEKGTMWATWYAGMTSGEDANNYVVIACSRNGGNNWKEILVIDPDGSGPVRAYDPEVWIDPGGKLHFFWAQAIGHEGTIAGVWSLTAEDPDSGDTGWSEPRRLTDGIMMCKPTVLSSGEWLLPVSTWRLTDESAKVIVSTDRGTTWTLRGACNVPKPDREYDEHMLVERKDGSLWMLVRTKYGIGESTSKDKGRTWSDLVRSDIQHTTSRFFIRRLSSGNLLLVKHGPIHVRTHRSHLMAFISKDDGQTWSKGLLLDERTGVSYPDGQQAADGRIHIVYDYSRTGEQLVLLTSFTENDILSEDYDVRIVEVFNRRKVVSDGGR